MALILPAVPTPRTALQIRSDVEAILATGTVLADPQPRRYLEDSLRDEALLEVVVAMREGLLTIDQAVTALVVDEGGASATDVAALRTALSAVQDQLDALAARPGGASIAQVVASSELATAYARLDIDGKVPPALMPQSVTEAVADRITLTQGKLPLSVIPDGVGGTPGPDSIGPTLLTPALRTQIASGGVGDGGVTEVKIAPAAVTFPKLGASLAGRVEVPKFVPQETPGVVGLPTVYTWADSPTITRAQTGLPSIYWPYLVRVPAEEYARKPEYGKWRLYCSTDHDPGAGGIACLKTDADVPGAPGAVWTSVTIAGNPIIFKKGTAGQVETPTVIYNAGWSVSTDRWRMYYQVQGSSQGAFAQYTEVASSPDGITGWTTIPGAGMPNPSNDWDGWKHTGYARVWFVDGQWVSWHLSGGGDQSTYGWSYSNDGLSWVMDRRRILSAAAWSGKTGRPGISGLMRYRGELWCIGSVAGFTSGTTTSAASMQWMAPMRPDLLGPKGRLMPVDRVTDPAIGEPPSFGPTFALADNGSLWGAYRTGDESTSFRFQEVK